MVEHAVHAAALNQELLALYEPLSCNRTVKRGIRLSTVLLFPRDMPNIATSGQAF